MQKDFYDEILESLRNDVEEDMTSDIYTDVKISDDIVCPLIAVNKDGVFILVNGSKDDVKKAHDLIPILHLTNAACMWLVSDDQDYFYDAFEDDIVPVDDIYISFFSIYYNILAGQANYKHSLAELAKRDEMDEVEVIEHDPAIKQSRVDVIKSSIVARIDSESNDKQSVLGKEYKTVDGVQYARTTDLLGRERWYTINDEIDPDELFQSCLYGGIVGAHKFKEGRVFAGLGYLFTVGCFGIFWIADVIAMLANNYRLKDGSFLGKVEKSKDLFWKIPLGLAISMMLVLGGAKGYNIIGSAIASSTAQEAATSIFRNKLSDMTSDEISEMAEAFDVSSDDLSNMTAEEFEALYEERVVEDFHELINGFDDEQTLEFEQNFGITTEEVLSYSYDELIDSGIVSQLSAESIAAD